MNIVHFTLANTINYAEVHKFKPVSSHLTEFAMECHKALLTCPNVIKYLLHKREIDRQAIGKYCIGFFDKALPFDDEDSQMVNYMPFEELRGCITVPIIDGDEIVGVQGELFNANSRTTLNSHLLCPSIVAEPFHFSKSVLRCLSQLDVYALQKHGYQNSFCDLSGSVSEMTFDTLRNSGVEVLVYFADVFGADFDVKRAEELANYYGVRLCEVKLPFTLSNFGLWDTYQWQLFDKRLSAALKSCNAYNERYQA